MAVVLFLKAHVKGYTRKDGVVVKPHERKPAVRNKAAKDHPSHSPHAVAHPQLGENGKVFYIKEPSVPSMAHTWTDPHATAVFVPSGETPEQLNGIPFGPWKDAPTSIDLWQDVDGQMHDLEEPELVTHGKEPAAGVVIEEKDGRVWIVCPTNGFSGYKATFPKGRADDGISLQATAIKEAFEESGLRVEITGLIGDVERTQTMTRYYRARRVGGTPATMGWETQAVQLVPKSAVQTTLNQDVDHTVAKLADLL